MNSNGTLIYKGSSNIGQNTRLYSNQQKKRTCKIKDFAVPADHRIELKESFKKRINSWTLLGTEKTMEHESDDYTSRD